MTLECPTPQYLFLFLWEFMTVLYTSVSVSSFVWSLPLVSILLLKFLRFKPSLPPIITLWVFPSSVLLTLYVASYSPLTLYTSILKNRTSRMYHHYYRQYRNFYLFSLDTHYLRVRGIRWHLQYILCCYRHLILMCNDRINNRLVKLFLRPTSLHIVLTLITNYE